MPQFEVFITETLSRKVTVEAKDEEEAFWKVRKGWHNEIYVLDSQDFIGVEFEVNLGLK